MGERTNISWADSTFNPWLGCSKVSAACDHCYAEKLMDKRMHRVEWGPGKPRVRTKPANWRQPEKWNAKRFMQCEDCGWRGEAAAPVIGCGACGSIELSDTRRRVFCASLADVFDNEVPAGWRAELFALIAQTPHLDWLLLTKRIGNVARMIEAPGMQKCGLPDNVWLGATICDQAEADRDIPKLLGVPAAVRFLSIEPMLGRVDLRQVHVGGHGHHEFDPIITANVLKRADIEAPSVHWVIAGGESGDKARPMHPDWVRSLRDQCAAARVPFLFKQWGEWTPGENVERVKGVVQTAFWWDEGWTTSELNLAKDHGHIDDQPDLYRVGTEEAGRLLDGKEHMAWPNSWDRRRTPSTAAAVAA